MPCGVLECDMVMFQNDMLTILNKKGASFVPDSVLQNLPYRFYVNSS